MAGAISAGVYVAESPFCERIAAAIESNTLEDITPSVSVLYGSTPASPSCSPFNASTAAAICDGL